MFSGKDAVLRADELKAMATTALVFTVPSVIAGLGWLHIMMPLPVFYFSTVSGLHSGLRITVWAAAATALITQATGNLAGFLFSLSILPVGYILARGRIHKEPLLASAGKGIIYLSLAWLMFGLLVGTVQQINPYQEILQGLERGYDAATALYKDSGQFGAEDLKAIQEFMARLKALTIKLFPALLMSSILCTVWLNVISGQMLFRKNNKVLAEQENLKTWRLPDALVWPVIMAGIALIVPHAQINTMGLNLGFVLLIAYLSQGLAIVASMLQHWAMPQFFRVMTYTLLFMQVYGIVLVAALGLAETWLDLRSRLTKQEME